MITDDKSFMELFTYSDYRAFIRNRLLSGGGDGRGGIKKLSEALRVSASLVGRILKGTKGFTEEQGARIASYFGLGEFETGYFINLVRLDRAGTLELQAIIKRELAQARNGAFNLEHEKAINVSEWPEEQQAIFFSNWYFSAIRLLASLSESTNLPKLASGLGLSPERVEEVLRFLTRSGLLVKKDGAFKLGPVKTVVDRSSRYLTRHHLNWRIKSLEHVSRAPGPAFAYTAPMTITKADAEELLRMIRRFTAKAELMMATDKPETFRCLLIDYFEL